MDYCQSCGGAGCGCPDCEEGLVIVSQKWYGWYDNGTGYFEGPYRCQSENKWDAIRETDIGYGAIVFQNRAYDPNKKGYKMKLVNLTPHQVNILNEDKMLVKVIEKSGEVARCSVTKKSVASEDGIVFYETVFGEVTGLPEKSDAHDVIYIVSLLVRNACPDRPDIYSPGELVRDDDGQPIGCIGLTR